MKTADPIDDFPLIESCLFLARLDDIIRKGWMIREYINFDHEDDLDIRDLRQLIGNCSILKLEPKKIILNPTFGKGSALVGGADGDLVIDDALIDIKVTKHLKLIRPDFNQLIGYYLLYLVGGITQHKEVEIKKLGIYFVRHDVLWTIPVSEIGDRKKFRTAIGFLAKKMRRRVGKLHR